MKLLTLSLTTKNPLMNPATRARAEGRRTSPRMSGIVSLLDSVAEMTSDIDMLAPIDRSKVPVASGIEEREGEASR